MAKNDRVLLDGIYEKARPQLPDSGDVGASFEIFVFNEILKAFDLSYEELLDGQVDGGDDGGVDGFFAFLNGSSLTEVPNYDDVRDAQFRVYVITVRHRDSFQQAPLSALAASLRELLDLERNVEDLKSSYNERLVEKAELFRRSYVALATNHPTLQLEVIYACRGDASGVNASVEKRRALVEATVGELFSNVEAGVHLLGAAELLQLARARPSYSLRLRFVESYIARAKGGYVLLARLGDYFKFITDDAGQLRRYLFESNVRDYMGPLSVNRAIEETLRDSVDRYDFWWLNNGITILASRATIAGKEISLENVQIVNGLQTTESIYKVLSGSGEDDDRAALVKVVVTDSIEARDRIIKATNTQTPVETASLRATDRIQRDLEQYLVRFGWYYDRRKNAFKNEGRSADHIVSMSQLGAAVQAVALRLPTVAHEQRTRYMRDDATYRRVFDETWDLDIYRACWELIVGIDRQLRAMSQVRRYHLEGGLQHLRFFLAALYAESKLGPRYRPEDVLRLVGLLPSEAELEDLLRFIGEAYAGWVNTGYRARNTRALARSQEFAAMILAESVAEGLDRAKGLARIKHSRVRTAETPRVRFTTPRRRTGSSSD